MSNVSRRLFKSVETSTL